MAESKEKMGILMSLMADARIPKKKYKYDDTAEEEEDYVPWNESSAIADDLIKAIKSEDPDLVVEALEAWQEYCSTRQEDSTKDMPLSSKDKGSKSSDY